MVLCDVSALFRMGEGILFCDLFGYIKFSVGLADLSYSG